MKSFHILYIRITIYLRYFFYVLSKYNRDYISKLIALFSTKKNLYNGMTTIWYNQLHLSNIITIIYKNEFMITYFDFIFSLSTTITGSPPLSEHCLTISIYSDAITTTSPSSPSLLSNYCYYYLGNITTTIYQLL